MKSILFIVCCILFFNSYSQDFDLLESKKEKGSFMYRIRVLNTEDSSSYSVVNDSSDLVEFLVLNNDGEPVFSSLTIKNNDSDSVQTYHSDFEGAYQLELTKGNYTLNIFEYMYEPLEIHFSKDDSIGRKFTIRLGRGPDLYPKVIYSKRKLNAEDLNGIVNCLYESKNFEQCSKKYQCIIMTEI